MNKKNVMIRNFSIGFYSYSLVQGVSIPSLAQIQIQEDPDRVSNLLSDLVSVPDLLSDQVSVPIADVKEKE
jgi:hypothetical protein